MVHFGVVATLKAWMVVSQVGFDPFWCILVQLVHLVHFSPIWYILSTFGTFWSYLSIFGLIHSNLATKLVHDNFLESLASHHKIDRLLHDRWTLWNFSALEILSKRGRDPIRSAEYGMTMMMLELHKIPRKLIPFHVCIRTSKEGGGTTRLS